MDHAQEAGVGGDSEHPEDHHPRSSSKERRIAAALKAINDTQAHGQEGARADPSKAAHQAGLDLGSERYEDALAYLTEQAALLGEAHLAFGDDVGALHPHGYTSYFFTRRALVLLEG